MKILADNRVAFPEIVSRIRLLKDTIVISKFHQNYTAKHQTGRRVPINIQPTITDEHNRLPKEAHIEKLTSCLDQNVISPIVITVQ